MESTNSIPEPSNEDAPSVQDMSINLQETFVTIQTKEGHSSQQIPLFQFLEQAIGSRIDGGVNFDNISQLLNGAIPEDSSKDSVQETIAITVPNIRGKQVSQSDKSVSDTTNGSTGNTQLDSVTIPKSKGRGRKKKVRTDITTELACNVTGVGRNEVLSDQTAVTGDSGQTLRRSSRVPTKNSKFKDDYVVESSLTSSKSSSDVRLMTLALAAECHTTKPTKRVRITGDSVRDTHPAKLIKLDGEADTAESVNKSASTKKVQLDAVLIKEENVNDSVLHRTLQTQLNLCLSSTEGKLMTTEIEKDKSQDSHFYVITDPLTEPDGKTLLVQGCQNKLSFNSVSIAESKLSEHSDVLSCYPQSRYFSCDLCQEIFHSSHKKQSHSKEIHNECLSSSKTYSPQKDGIHTCKLCGQKFPFQFMLEKHLQKKIKCNSHTCSACEQVFSFEVELEEHNLLSHPVTSCNLCGKLFDSSVVLRNHLKESHGSSLDQFTSIDSKLLLDSASDNSIIKYKSPIPIALKNRTASQSVSNVTVETRTKSYKVMLPENTQCDLCELKFSNASELWFHRMEIHQEYFPSDYRERLESRLKKNEVFLSSFASAVHTYDNEKANYFIIMKPSWCLKKSQLDVSLEDKSFTFSPAQPISCPDGSNLADSSPDVKTVLFYCVQCSSKFLSAFEYRDHRSKVHGECFESSRRLVEFECSSCSDTFPCQFMLEEHAKKHKSHKMLPCTLCGMTFYKIPDRRLHWKQAHPGVGCPNCGKMYASISYLQKHIALNCQDHFPASKKFIAFRQQQHSDFHMEEKEKRTEKKILKCHLCPKICCSVHGWRRHMTECHEVDGFSKLSNTCIICNQVVYGYKALEKHLLEVHAEDSGLPLEEESTIVLEAVKNSKIDITDYLRAGKSDAKEIYQDEEGMYHCPECPKIHADLKALNVHRKIHVNMQLECSICNKTFRNPTLLKQHVVRHRSTAVYACETCDKKFKTIQKLNKHNKVHHSTQRYVCELCGVSFALNDYLLKHKRCHSDNRPHVCSVCKKTFRTRPELRVHLLIHTQETPYVCEHCGRGFTQKGNWRIHLAQHTGVKPHKCELCELSFALPSHLKRHLQTHNQKINYRCLWCDKECTQRKHMQMHVGRVHKEDFLQYEKQMKLDNPIPIAPSQMKIYNRSIGKAGQIRRPYRTRAKKCKSSTDDIMNGVADLIEEEEEEEEIAGATIIESEEMVISDTLVKSEADAVESGISIEGQEIVSSDNMQILVQESHEYTTKHNSMTANLIEEDGSNVEIVMGENNEINIIINNNIGSSSNSAGINTSDLSALSDSLDENGHILALSHLTDPSGSLHQAVNALVSDNSEDTGGIVDPDDTEALGLDVEAMMAGDHPENFTIVYPSSS